jgi:hypothetical protein
MANVVIWPERNASDVRRETDWAVAAGIVETVDRAEHDASPFEDDCLLSIVNGASSHRHACRAWMAIN